MKLLTFGEQLKKIRVLQGLSQSQTAKKLQIPLKTYIAWEQGQRTPPVYTQEIIKMLLLD